MADLKETPKAGRIARLIFGIIMIIIYVGMGVLMFTPFFDNTLPSWAKIPLGVLFVLYGIWRAIRQFKGIDSRM